MIRRVLVIEDEKKLADLLGDYLTQAGFDVSLIYGGVGAVDSVRRVRPDLIILDLMLPGSDGMEICGDIRSFSDVPIIIVTARVAEDDRLLGLRKGADDYICKPFSPREVVARVEAVLRRARSVSTPEPSGLHLDERRHRATWFGRDLNLTEVEFKLLLLLYAEPGRVFERRRLMGGIYPDNRTVCDRTIDSHIKKLRKKMADTGSGVEVIHSVYGIGYKYEPSNG